MAFEAALFGFYLTVLTMLTGDRQFRRVPAKQLHVGNFKTLHVTYSYRDRRLPAARRAGRPRAAAPACYIEAGPRHRPPHVCSERARELLWTREVARCWRRGRGGVSSPRSCASPPSWLSAAAEEPVGIAAGYQHPSENNLNCRFVKFKLF